MDGRFGHHGFNRTTERAFRRAEEAKAIGQHDPTCVFMKCASTEHAQGRCGTADINHFEKRLYLLSGQVHVRQYVT